MKKILTTILAGTLVAGAAFATDAKISLSYRTRLDAFSLRTYDNGKGEKNSKTTTQEWIDWGGYNKSGGQGTDFSDDSMKFVLNGDVAGATLTLKLTPKGAVELKEYYGWMQFNVGLGALTFRGGHYDSYSVGAYRVNNDAGNMEGVDFETWKLGSIFNGTAGLKYVDDLTNDKKFAGYADYGFKVNDDISLNVLVGGLSTKFDSDTDEDGDQYYWDSALVSRIQFGMKGVLDAQFIYKKITTTSNTFALYVMPKILDEFTLNVGGAVELADDETDWGVDLRLRYQVMDPLSITFFTNISGTTLDIGRNLSSGIAGRNANWGLKGKNLKNPTPQFKVAMWNHLGARYKINDLLTAGLDLGLITPLSKAKDTNGNKDKNSYSPEWRVTPAIEIFASSKASLWAGVAISGASVEDASSFNVDVPVIFRVKM